MSSLTSSSLTSLEAYDLLRFSELLESRLAQAEVAQASRKGLEREKAWLTEAHELLRAARAEVPPVLERARELPELAEVREDYALELQGAWVDTLEKLHAGITFHASSRAPILETLFPHSKFPALRKAPPDGVRAYAAEFDRRSRLGYSKRIFAREDFAFAVPIILGLPEALRRWEACFQPSTMSEEDAAPIRETLAEAAYRLERSMRQARLLAEAALVPVPGAFEEAGLGARPRRRVGSVMTEPPPLEEGAIEDDGVSLADALAAARARATSEEATAPDAPDAPGAPDATGQDGATESLPGAAAPDVAGSASEADLLGEGPTPAERSSAGTEAAPGVDRAQEAGSAGDAVPATGTDAAEAPASDGELEALEQGNVAQQAVKPQADEQEAVEPAAAAPEVASPREEEPSRKSRRPQRGKRGTPPSRPEGRRRT